MEHEHFSIELDGEEADDLYGDILSMEVELDEDMAGMFRIRLSAQQNRDGTWAYLDDERLSVWKKVVIRAGFAGAAEEIIAGYITHVRPAFEPEPAQTALEVWGMDASVLMDREEKLKDWPNKKDSDIAAELFSAYGLTPDVEDTAVVHDEKVSTIIQRETDMQFLRRLALRNGFECYVEGSTGSFASPKVSASSQPVLAVHFGQETNVNRLALEINALAPASVSMCQVDRAEKKIVTVSTERSLLASLGRTGAAGLLGPGMNPGLVHLGRAVATGTPEMTALCQGLFHQADWFVTGSGEIAGNHYGHVLRPRQTVAIKGAGEAYSGRYYVTRVTHSFSLDGYIQSFQVKRNALMPSGLEDFSSSAGVF